MQQATTGWRRVDSGSGAARSIRPDRDIRTTRSGSGNERAPDQRPSRHRPRQRSARTSGRSSDMRARPVPLQRSTTCRRPTGCGGQSGTGASEHRHASPRSLSRQISTAHASTASRAKSIPIHIVRCGVHVMVTVTGEVGAGKPPAVEAARDLSWRTQVGGTLLGLPSVVEALAEDQPAPCGAVGDGGRARRARALRRWRLAAPGARLAACCSIAQDDPVDIDPRDPAGCCCQAMRACSEDSAAAASQARTVDRVAREQLGDGLRGRPRSQGPVRRTSTRSVRQSGAAGKRGRPRRSTAPRSR